MKFDRKKFFDDYKGRFGGISDQRIVDGLNFLLGEFENDKGFTQIRELAYVLATIRGETGIYQPIKEKRASRIKQPALWATQNRYWNAGYFGRGYVQLTWENNYLNAGKKLKGLVLKRADGTQLTIGDRTFVETPDLVMEPAAAYLILSRGMLEGWFTTKKLSDYIKPGKAPDYVNARKIINGTNKQHEFANAAEKFELILRASES